MPNPRSEFDNLTEPDVRSTLKAMRRSLKRMRDIVKQGRGSDFDLFVARQKAQAIEKEIASLEKDLAQRLGQAIRKAVPIADQLNAEAPVNLIGIDASIAARAESEAARMVRNVADRVRREINDAAVKATTGELDRAQFEAGIADALDVDVMDARVERIARTELGELFEMQGAEADARLADDGADLIKVWSHKCGGRPCPGARMGQRGGPNHVALHGQERELWQSFNVGGGATADTPPASGIGEEAMRPLDPKLSAKERINCGCTAVRKPRSEAKKSYIANVNPRASEAGAAR